MNIHLQDSVFKDIVEQVRDIVLVFTAEGETLYANQTAIEAYEYPRRELIGKNVRDLRSPYTRSDVTWQIRYACQSGLCFRTVHLRKNGNEFPVQVSSSRAFIAGQEMVVSIIRDISDIMAIEQFLVEKEEKLQDAYQELLSMHEEMTASNEELQQQFAMLQERDIKIVRQNTYLQALHDTARSLMQGYEITAVLQHILFNAAQMAGTPHGVVFQLDQKEQQFVYSTGCGVYEKQDGITTACSKDVVESLKNSKSLLVIENGRIRQGEVAILLQAVLWLPLLAAGEIIGIIGLAHSVGDRCFTDEDKEALILFGELASIALDNAMTAAAAQEEVRSRQWAEYKLMHMGNKYQAIFDNVNDGILLYGLNSKQILEINPKACEILGIASHLPAGGKRKIADIFTQPSAGNWRQIARQTLAGTEQLVEYSLIGADGRTKWLQVNIKRIMMEREMCLLGVIRDITLGKNQEMKIRDMAYYDSLTGLANRRLLHDRVAQELARVERGESLGGAILFIDLDDFKTVNDTLGHSFGDTIIIKAGEYLLNIVGDRSRVARIGGDEFCVLLPDEICPELIGKLADTIIRIFNQHHEHVGHGVYLSASIGIALYPKQGSTIEELYKKADLAMYKAKENKKNNWVFFQPDWQQEALKTMQLKQGLRKALESQEFMLMYQPIVHTKTREIVSFEALIRWNSRNYGIIRPDVFIPMAEEMQLMHEIGQWVISEACCFAKSLNALGREHIRISINLSPSQLLQENFAVDTIALINNSGIRSRQIEFEITENLLVSSLEKSCRQLHALRQHGIDIALDDFGTGYSSLTYLRQLPVTKLKIDKSFVDALTNAEELKLFQSIVNMAHTMELHVVAEGVETQEQMQIIQQCACDYVQGYFYSRPMQAELACRYLID